jgi:DNA polymerase bacteriophage-type
MTTLYLDFETFSDVPISHGTHRYSERVDIMLAARAVDDGPVDVLDFTAGDAEIKWSILRAELDAADEIVIHNSMFDRTVLRYAQNYEIPLHKIRDTMVTAMAHSLPGGLAKLCEIMRVPLDQAKDKDGKRLIQLFCVPRPKNLKLRRATRETHPADWALFVDYARLDIEAMRAVDKKLPRWNLNETERELWYLDQEINDAGVLIDTELVAGAIETVDRARDTLTERTIDLTEDKIYSVMQRDELLKFILETFDVPLDDLRASTLEKTLEHAHNYPPELIELLNVRLQASIMSVAKYKVLRKATSTDGRLRGCLQYCGASRTGRWAGRVFQPQNLPRPKHTSEEIETGIEAIKSNTADLVFDNVMELASSALRGVIISPPGKKLVVADLSNIEGRVLAWLAGEEWKLQAFAEFDAGRGHDLYKLAYARSFGVDPETVTKPLRQIGKVQELALGYEGGPGAFLTFAVAYGIDLDAMAELARPALSRHVLGAAAQAWDRNVAADRPTMGLAKDTWIVVDAIKRAWREAHPATTELWRDVANAVRAVINGDLEKTIQVGYLGIRRDKAWLRIILPSGRSLCYPSPRLDDGVISYMGVNQYTRRWERVKTYSGKLVENITQAVARDVLAHGMLVAKKSGAPYRIVLSIHDELLTETPDDPLYSHETLSLFMSQIPAWAPGLPLAAAGFETHRYKKDD